MNTSRLLGLILLAAFSNSSTADVLIRNVDIISSGKQYQAPQDVLVVGNTIKSIGSNLSATDNVKIVDGSGKRLSVGFFNSNTELGIREVGAVAGSVDSSSMNPRITASLKIADAVNPSSVLLPHNRAQGLTHALVTPSSGASLFAGTAAIIQLSDADTVVKESAALVVELSSATSELAGGSRAAAMALLREAFEDARDYSRNKSSYNSGSRRDYQLSRHDLEAIVPVLEKRLPLLVYVDRAVDIRRVLNFAKTQRINLILAGVEEGWRIADEIAAAKVPVIMDPINNLPSSYDSLGSRLDSAKLLNDAGVKLLFTGMSWHSTHNAYLVRQSAGNAVANGLPYDVAIAASTSNPAEVFGLKNSGSVTVGNFADLVLWDGDPLEPSTNVSMLMIGGQEVPLVSRNTRLRDRYYSIIKDAAR